MSVFILIPKKGNAKDCSSYHTIVLISNASKIIPKILQASLQQYMNQKIPDVQAGFRKGRGTRDQVVNIGWIIESWGNLENICFTDCVKVFDCVDHNKMCKILKEMGIPASLPPEKPVCRSRRNS